MSAGRPAFALRGLLPVLLQRNSGAVLIPCQELLPIVEDVLNLADELAGAELEASHQNALKKDARREKNEAEQKAKAAEEKTKVAEKTKAVEEKIDKHLYAVLLVDGDVAIFWDEFFRNPKDGAKEAAKRLRKAIKESLKNNCMRVLVKVYVNVDDLAERLETCGVIQSKGALMTFANYFTDSFPECEFVNVGSEKTTKMRSMLSHYYHQAQCKKIYFAGCRDDTYIETLHFFKIRRPESLDKVVLVETTPVSPNLRDLGFRFASFENVFRPVALPSREEQGTSNEEPITVLCREMPGRISPYIDQGPFDQGQPSACSSALHAPPMERSVPNTNTHHKPMVSIPASPRKIFVNKQRKRVDQVNKPPRRNHFDSYNRKLGALHESGGIGFCNAHYLNGICNFGDRCRMEHEIKLAGQERAVLRYMARTMKCKKGFQCRDYDCLASHHCPWDVDCNRKRDDCKFPHLKLEEKVVWYTMEEGKSEPDYLC